MAKKSKSKKDKEDIEKDEEINEGAQENINEADDSFGLPDLDFKPLDEMEEDKPEEGSEESEEMDEPEESEEIEGEEKADFIEEADPFEDDELNDLDEASQLEEGESESITPPPRKFEHPEKSSAAPKIIIGILLVIIVLAGGYYFGFYKPQQAEKARIEQEEQERQEAEARRLEEERQAQLAREREQAAMEEEPEPEPETGTVNRLSEASGRYYVVINSFIDDDLAMDYANTLADKGVNTVLLEPLAEKGYYRLVLAGDHGTWSDAQSVAEQNKGQYGNEVWVLKY